MKFDQDLCLNLRYDFGKMNSTLGSVVPLAMFTIIVTKMALLVTLHWVSQLARQYPDLRAITSRVTCHSLVLLVVFGFALGITNTSTDMNPIAASRS